MTAQLATAKQVTIGAAQIMGDIIAARIDGYLLTVSCEVEALTKELKAETDQAKAKDLAERLKKCLI